MANVSDIRGAVLVGHVTGSADNARIRTYYVPATDGTALYIGDFVKLAGGVTTDGKTPVVTAAAATNAMVGVVMGVDPVKGIAMSTTPDLSKQYRPASTAMYLRVCDDPDALFMIQEDGVGGTIAAADGTKNASIIVAAGSTTSGFSGTMLDSSTVATGATLELKLLGIQDTASNALGANCKWLVKINNHQLATSTGTAGV